MARLHFPPRQAGWNRIRYCRCNPSRPVCVRCLCSGRPARRGRRSQRSARSRAWWCPSVCGCAPSAFIRFRRDKSARPNAKLNPFVNLTPVADVMQMNPARFQIKFVKHAVIAGAEFEFRATLQPFVRKMIQSHSHFVNFALQGLANAGRQIVKGFREGVRPDLERSSHNYAGWRVVQRPSAISRRDWSSLAFTSSASSSWSSRKSSIHARTSSISARDSLGRTASIS